MLAGEVPGADVEGLFVMFGDAAEMRSEGVEVALHRRSAARLQRAGRRPATGRWRRERAERAELPADYRLETSATQLIVWRPIAGNLVRTAEGSDRFRARAGEVVRRLIYGRELAS